jgi:hypothetical protein
MAGGVVCQSSSCGSCSEAGCSYCGGAGQDCCVTGATAGSGTGTGSGSGGGGGGSDSCTAPFVVCVATAASIKVCEACGGAGQACCQGTTCASSAGLVCSNKLCVACGGVGQPCCALSADAGVCDASLTCGTSSVCGV